MIDIKNLNHYVGVCGKCGDEVKMCYILGWGLVPKSARCIKCGCNAKTNSSGCIIITMEEK